jgi:predicted small secreted protein
MRNSTKLLILVLFTLSGATLLLSGCNTIAGAGEDVSQAGHTIHKTAEKHAP